MIKCFVEYYKDYKWIQYPDCNWNIYNELSEAREKATSLLGRKDFDYPIRIRYYGENGAKTIINL